MKTLITTFIVLMFTTQSEGQNLPQRLLGFKANNPQTNAQSDPYSHRLEELHLRLEKLKGQRDYRELAYTWYILGNHHKRFGYYNHALQSFKEALKLSERLREAQQVAQISIHIGSTLNYMDRNREALDYFHRSLEIAEVTRFDAIRNPVYQHLSFTYTALEEHDKAYKYRKLLGQH